MEFQTEQKNGYLWLNAHAFAEYILCGGRALPWVDATHFADVYKQLQGILAVERLSVPLVGFLDSWVTRNRYVLTTMAGEKHVCVAIKRLLTNSAMREELKDLFSEVCAVVEAEVMLELPSNTSLVSWANRQANPEAAPLVLTDLDIDSTSVYLADTVRELKAAGIGGVVSTIADADIDVGATAGHYQPLSNVAANYHWRFAFRRPIQNRSSAFDADGITVLGPVSTPAQSVVTLPTEFWQQAQSSAGKAAECYYSELPAFAEPDVVRQKIRLLKGTYR